jgi:NDP-sugar pyrophosphorylase family protein
VRGVEYPAPWVASNADVDLRARLGRWVAVGAEARIGADAEVDESVVHPGASVGDGARVRGTVVGPGAHVGAGASLEGCVLGAGARVADGLALAGAKVGTDAEAVADHL